MKKELDFDKIKDILEKIEKNEPLNKEEGYYKDIIESIKIQKQKEQKINILFKADLKEELLTKYDQLYPKKSSFSINSIFYSPFFKVAFSFGIVFITVFAIYSNMNIGSENTMLKDTSETVIFSDITEDKQSLDFEKSGIKESVSKKATEDKSSNITNNSFKAENTPAEDNISNEEPTSSNIAWVSDNDEQTSRYINNWLRNPSAAQPYMWGEDDDYNGWGISFWADKVNMSLAWDESDANISFYKLYIFAWVGIFVLFIWIFMLLKMFMNKKDDKDK